MVREAHPGTATGTPVHPSRVEPGGGVKRWTVPKRPTRTQPGQQTGSSGNRFPFPSLPSGQPMPVRTAQPYPTTAPPLSAADIAEFAQRRSFASRRLKETLARREAGTQESEQGLSRLLERIGVTQRRSERDLGNHLGGRSLSMSPMFMGKGVVDIRNASDEARVEAQTQHAQQLAALEEMVRQARLGRDEEIAAISREETRRRTPLDRLIRGV